MTSALGSLAFVKQAGAQQLTKVWRIGFLAGGARPALVETHHLGGFLEGMRELGYIDGRDFLIEARYADGEFQRFPALASELVSARVEIVVVGTGAAIKAVQQAASTIPIVVGYSTDLVGSGFAKSLARPGGNVTGLESDLEQTIAKQLELAFHTVNGLARVAVLSNPDGQSSSWATKGLENDAVRSSGVEILHLPTRNPAEIEAAFSRMAEDKIGAVLVVSDSIFSRQRKQIAELGLQHRLPSVFAQREYVEAGGLMSYGDSLRNFLKRSAHFVDRIIRGATPGDLPIERPTAFHLVINLKTAKAIGLTIPSTLLARADEVIE
jgi:putative ABC transport system substrate-binding protein